MITPADVAAARALLPDDPRPDEEVVVDALWQSLWRIGLDHLHSITNIRSTAMTDLTPPSDLDDAPTVPAPSVPDAPEVTAPVIPAPTGATAHVSIAGVATLTAYQALDADDVTALVSLAKDAFDEAVAAVPPITPLTVSVSIGDQLTLTAEVPDDADTRDRFLAVAAAIVGVVG